MSVLHLQYIAKINLKKLNEFLFPERYCCILSWTVILFRQICVSTVLAFLLFLLQWFVFFFVVYAHFSE